MIDKKLLEIITCPACHGTITEKNQYLICEKCKKAYLKFYFRPRIIWRQFARDIKSWGNLKRDFAYAFSLLIYGRTSKDHK